VARFPAWTAGFQKSVWKIERNILAYYIWPSLVYLAPSSLRWGGSRIGHFILRLFYFIWLLVSGLFSGCSQLRFTKTPSCNPLFSRCSQLRCSCRNSDFDGLEVSVKFGLNSGLIPFSFPLLSGRGVLPVMRPRRPSRRPSAGWNRQVTSTIYSSL